MIETIDEHAATPSVLRESVRAGLYCGLFAAAIGMTDVREGDISAPTGVGALLVWGGPAFLGGFLSVYRGGVRRNGFGGWSVSPAFVALAVGTPLATVAALLLAGALDAPYGPAAIMGAALWLGGVAAVWIARRRQRSGESE